VLLLLPFDAHPSIADIEAHEKLFIGGRLWTWLLGEKRFLLLLMEGGLLPLNSHNERYGSLLCELDRILD